MTESQTFKKSEAANIVKPMEDVTFQFSAIALDSTQSVATDVKHSVLITAPVGVVTTSPTTITDLVKDTAVTLTVTPGTGKHLTSFTLNGVDHLDDASDGSVALTIGSADVRVVATVDND